MNRPGNHTSGLTRLSPSIHPAYARLLCAHLNSRGVDLERVFAGTSLDWESLLARQRFVSYEQFKHLSDRAIELTGCPWLGLEISSIIQVSSHGPLGYGALASRDVRTAMSLVQRMMSTRLALYKFDLEEREASVDFRAQELLDTSELREFVQVMFLGSFFDLIEKIIGSTPKGISVTFPFAEPLWSDKYYARFQDIKIHFGGKDFVIEMPLSLLDMPCLTADDFAYRNAVRECEALLDQKKTGSVFSDRIMAKLTHSEAPFPLQEDLAKDFGLSTRTLIRKLKSENTSYQDLLDEVRKELACWYLQAPETSVELVAEKLGFQDTSNFSRVFRRWFGQTPSEFRKGTRL